MNIFDQYRCHQFSETPDSYKLVFQHFDENRDGYLDLNEFNQMLQDLFAKEYELNGHKCVSDGDIATFFSVLDLDHDGRISLEEFRCAWLYWLQQILKPVKALVIVDVQNDFISGSLSLCNCPAGQDALPVIPVINSLLELNLFDVVVYTLDWHPENHISFIDNVSSRKFHSTSQVSCEDVKMHDKVVFDVNGTPREQILWPKHCTQGSWGAELHPDLKVLTNGFQVKKGMKHDIDSYSAFWDNEKLSKTELSAILSKYHVSDVYVCGLAYDICVGFTANHAVEHGFRTIFIEDGTRGVDVDGIRNMKATLTAKGVYFAHSSQVPDLVKAKLRPMCLAAQAAWNYKLAWRIVKGQSTK